MKREFVQLAHKFQKKVTIGGWYLSEKMDGHRCYWDGGISRGIEKSRIPWANLDKDERYVETQYATGLWSRYGNVIHAPDWFLDALPMCPLDGELWSPDLTRQEISSIIKALDSGEKWRMISYNVFDIPPYETMFANGFIDNTNFKKKIVFNDCMAVVECFQNKIPMDYVPPATLRYESAYAILDAVINGKSGTRARPFVSLIAKRVVQKQLPYSQGAAIEVSEAWTQNIVNAGGEGAMIRDPNATYVCGRSHSILKLKPTEDMEGTVIGYITGRATDKGSKLLGMMGAAVLTLDSGQRLELSGFTDSERLLTSIDPTKGLEATEWARNNPETECPEWIEALSFPRGTRVSFKYRGLSNEGIPQEARYWRKDERI